VTRAAAPVRPRRVPNPEKAAKDRARMKTICDAFGGQVPDMPQGVCSAVR